MDPSSTKKVNKQPNIFLQALQNHYRGHNVYIPDVGQIERDKWLFPQLKLIRFNRWFTIFSAITIQFCCGSLYSWSVLNDPIDQIIRDPMKWRPAAAITFYLAIGTFGISASILGPWMERKGPKYSCLFGNCLFLVGNLLAGISIYFKCIWLLYFGYGIIGSIGLGLCYMTPVCTLQKWFPDRRGLSAGLAISGFGLGSFAMAKIQIPLINSIGLPLTFITLGWIYFILIFISALILRNPSLERMKPSIEIPAEDNMVEIELEIEKQVGIEDKVDEINIINLLLSRDFLLLYMIFVSNCLFGLVIISRLSNMITDIFNKSQTEAATIVAINGGFNLVGRIIYPGISDYFGRRNCYFLILSMQLFVIGFFPLVTGNDYSNDNSSDFNYWIFLGFMWCITSCSGGGVGVISGYLSDLFGSDLIGIFYGIILSAWSLAGLVGGLIFSGLFEIFQSPGEPERPYNLNMYWIFTVTLFGFIGLFFVTPSKLDLKFNMKFKICSKNHN